ncbi:hypothetical protein PO909_030330, partial [Leuciscus waleckii]
SDDEGRYSIGAQANVGLFNLQKLLEALKPLLTSDQLSQSQQILREYPQIYHQRFHELFKAKLGFLGNEEKDSYVIAFLLKVNISWIVFFSNCTIINSCEKVIWPFSGHGVICDNFFILFFIKKVRNQ